MISDDTLEYQGENNCIRVLHYIVCIIRYIVTDIWVHGSNLQYGFIETVMRMKSKKIVEAY